MPEYRVEDCIGADHPSLPGHFPGRPLVPGVLILERVVAALRQAIGSSQIVGAPAIKFLRPLFPEQRYTIILQIQVPTAHFRCEAAGQLLAQGSLSLSVPP